MGALRVPFALTNSQQSLCRGHVVILERAQRSWGDKAVLSIRSSLLPHRERTAVDLRRSHEEPAIWERLIGSRFRRISALRAINSARYRLDKEKEKETQLEVEEDDSDLCPVECVREFTSQAEFDEILGHAKEQGSLVVVDFFRTACGSCKYIEKGFVKLCKGAGNSEAQVIFLKHNVMDEYEEQSEIADRLRIKVVPLFHFYKDGKLVESFPTREKTKILDAIVKHTDLTLYDLDQGGK